MNLILVLVVAMAVSVGFGWLILLPFRGFIRSTVKKVSGDPRPDDASRSGTGQVLFNLSIVVGAFSLLVAIVSWNVTSLTDPVTLFFGGVAAAEVLVWVVFGRKY